ncbi:hypothetical protein B0T13DRAFT_81257 [Neurospora crassa]|nr:hypothetical protein B0T13DRAFT_81257 [Neurospora crassa]
MQLCMPLEAVTTPNMSGLPNQELSKEWTLAAWNLVPLSVGVAVKIVCESRSTHSTNWCTSHVY